MNRRGFLSNLLKLGIAPMILPPALTYAREWVVQGELLVPQTPAITPALFEQFLVDQQPNYDRLILESIRPLDGWIGHVTVGSFPQPKIDYCARLEAQYPDVSAISSNPFGRLKRALNRFADRLAIS